MKEYDENDAKEKGIESNPDITDQGKLYDTSLIESVSDSPEFFKKMIVLFVDTVSNDFELLKAEATKNNWKEVGQIAHKLKSTISSFKVDSLVPYTKELEIGKNDPLTIIKKLEDGLLKVLGQIKTDYKQLF
ncbi:MAG: response regulator [Mucilaginibacter sp.]|nr:response regulator [Mucilaginibacter sp.]